MASERLPLAAAMIVRDEEATLACAIQSVAPVVSQLVVVDTGSRDGTVELARSLGAEVHSIRWTDNFAAARNEALARVGQPWVLVLDADEELVADDVPTLARAVASPFASGYNLRVVSLVGSGREFTDARVTRLFRVGPTIRYRGRVHEQVADSLIAAGGSLASLDVRLLHTGYLPAVMTAKHKQERNLALLSRAAGEEPDQPYWQFQLGQTLLALGRVDEARTAYAASASRLAPTAPLAPVVVASAIRAAVAAEDWAAAEGLARAGVATHPSYTDLYWLWGLVLLQRDRLDAARTCFERCLALGPPRGYLQSELGVGTYLPKVALAEVAQKAGHGDQALAWLLSALRDQPGRLATWMMVDALTAGTPPEVLAQHLGLVLSATLRQQIVSDLEDLPPRCRAALTTSAV